MRRTTLAVVTMVLVGASASAQETPKIQTGASITIRVPADRVDLVVGVSARADRAKDAAARVAATLNAVRDALVKLGLDRSKLPSAGYGVSADYNDTRQPSAYVATSSLSVELENLGLLGAVVDAALAAGANQVTDIRFRPKDEQQARARALEQAVARARGDAEVLARASGVTLGPLLLVTTQRVSGFGPAENMVMLSSALPRATEIPPPEISVTAVVQVEWAIAR